MHIGFPALGIFLLICIGLTARYRFTGRKYEHATDEFWRRELNGDLSVRRDVNLEELPYLKVPLSQFPSDEALLNDEVYMDLLEQIRALADKRMLNLTEKTNTDLKLEYGRNHLEEMQKIGENFDALTVLLVSVAKRLVELSRYEDAVTVLEYGVKIGTDISTNYTLLGDCYANLGTTHKIPRLIETVEATDMVMKSAILTHLRPLLPENRETEDFDVE